MFWNVASARDETALRKCSDGTAHSVPASAGAGSNARLRRGVPMSRALRRHRAQSTVLRPN